MQGPFARGRRSAFALVVLLIAAAPAARQDVPEDLAPFEPLVGGWKGTAIPPANRLKGWQEKHAWAWKFSKGKPVGLTFALDGNKQLAKGQLAPAGAPGVYHLEGTDADDNPVRYVGTLGGTETGRLLTLKKDPEKPGDDQITLKWFDDRPRYTFTVDRREKGATRLTRLVDVGLTKEGESLGRSEAASQPKCIITGGSAIFSVTYQGKSYPLCCTGCRDEFNENPEKYVAKAAKLGLATDAAPAPAAPKAEPAGKAATGKAAPKAEPGPGPAGKAEAPDPNVKAASLLRQAQTLERAKKFTKAREFYQQILKEHPESPQAKTAEEKIKALEDK